MSDTIVDMPKVTQMLDVGWQVCIEKNEMGTYTAEALHLREDVRRRIARKLRVAHESVKGQIIDYDADFDWDEGREWLHTDDFTPEQALTRIAYKVFGEII